MAPGPSSSDGDNREEWANLRPTEEDPWFLTDTHKYGKFTHRDWKGREDADEH